MKNILSIILLFVSTVSFAEWMPPNCSLVRTVADPSLEIGQTAYKFTFMNFCDTLEERPIGYDIDGVGTRALLDSTNSITLFTKAGVHSFYFEYSPNYRACENFFNAYPDSLQSLAGYRSEFLVYFADNTPDPVIHLEPIIIDQPVVTFKPVIYLYPEERMDIKVELDIHGDKPFLYPEYKDGWNVSASPNGDLLIDGSTYNYLFWEATHYNRITPKQLTTGFVVQGSNTISFLEEKLTQAGLTSKEQADFITFWGPKLQVNNANYVHFVFNEECDEFADLSITPNPDNVYRIYILWSPIHKDFSVEEQKIIPAKRNGFTVIEWGGQKHTINQHIN